jgi:hypothetical protein
MRWLSAPFRLLVAAIASVCVRIKVTPGNPFKVRVDLSDRPPTNWRVRLTARIKMNRAWLKAVAGKALKWLLVCAGFAAVGAGFWLHPILTALILLAPLWLVLVMLLLHAVLLASRVAFCYLRWRSRGVELRELLKLALAEFLSSPTLGYYNRDERLDIMWLAVSELPESSKAAIAALAWRTMGVLPVEAEELLAGDPRAAQLLANYGREESPSGAERISLMRARQQLKDTIG